MSNDYFDKGYCYHGGGGEVFAVVLNAAPYLLLPVWIAQFSTALYLFNKGALPVFRARYHFLYLLFAPTLLFIGIAPCLF
jgi:hypothetical protein